MLLKVKLLDTCAKLPVRASTGAAGYDLHALNDGVIEARSQSGIKTGIAIAVPDGHYGRIAPRSGLAFRDKLDVMAGVIDSDYRGEVVVILFNHSDKPFSFKSGDRIAQLILEKCSTPPVKLVDDLDNTSRGEGGFGSTGK